MITIARDARAGPGGASSTIGANSVWFSGAKPGAEGAEVRGCGLSAGNPLALAIAPIVIKIAPSAAIRSHQKGPINWPDWRIV